MRKLMAGTLTFGLLTLALAPTAMAQVYADQGAIEIYAGYYSPGPDFDDDATYGLRLGYMVNDNFRFEGTVGRTVLDHDFSGFTGDVELEILMIEFTFGYVFAPDARFNPMLSGGIGWANQDVNGTVTGPGGEPFVYSGDDDSLTLHAGIDGFIHLGERAWLRPGFRARYFEERDEDEIDTEFTLAVGFKF